MKIDQRVQEMWSEKEIDGVNPMTLKVDLDLESADPDMGSAHRLTERIIWFKLTINRLNGSEDIKRIQNRRINPTTLKCDLDIE